MILALAIASYDGTLLVLTCQTTKTFLFLLTTSAQEKVTIYGKARILCVATQSGYSDLSRLALRSWMPKEGTKVERATVTGV